MRLITHLLLGLFISTGCLFPQTIGEEFQVNTYIPGSQTNPSISSDSQGNFVVVWTSDVEWDEPVGLELTEIFARIFFSDGIPKESEFQVNSEWTHLQEYPVVAMGENGYFAIAWVSYQNENPGYVGISARVYDNNGNPLTPEFVVNDYTQDYQGAPAIAMDQQGHFVITWQSWGQDGDSLGIITKKFDQDGVPLTGDIQVNTYSKNDQMHPKIAMEKNGSFVIVWTSYGQDGDKTGVFAQRFDRDANKLGKEFQANSSSLGWQEWPDIAMDDSGNFIIGWHSFQYEDGSYNIYARTFDQTASLKGPEILVNELTGSWNMCPAIGADKDGNFIITWQGLDINESTFDIYARSFNRQGTPQENPSLINTATQSSQELPDIFMENLNHFIIVWQSMNNMDTTWDIYAHIFTSPLSLLSPPLRINRDRHDTKKTIPYPLYFFPNLNRTLF